MIGPVRRESSTVVACVGEVSEPLLADLARSPNIALVRPPEGDEDRLAAAARALAEAGRRAATYVLVTADPLAGVAAEWRAMWDLSAGAGAARPCAPCRTAHGGRRWMNSSTVRHFYAGSLGGTGLQPSGPPAG